MRSTARILSVVAASLFAALSFAQDLTEARSPEPLCAAVTPSSPGASPIEGPYLTGDWLGSRSAMASGGITFDLSTTQFYEGVARGGLQQAFQYGGRNDYFMNVDCEKAGLWKGASFTLHGETRYGEADNFITGALAPVNLMLSVPLSSGSVSGLTGVRFTQVLSENTLVYVGKLNTLDDFKQPLTGAGPLSGFQNSAMIYNPVYARTIPYSTFGAGFAYLRDAERVLEVAVYDTNNTPTSSGFNTLFSNGATLYVQGTVPTTFFDRPGHQGVSGTYSSGTYTDLTPTAYLDPIEGLVLLTTPVTGSWCLTYGFDQAIFVALDDSQRMWGVFGNLGIADNNPSPVRWFANTGISGTSPIAGRKADSFGIAWFYIGVSDGLKDRPTDIRSRRDEHGVELYYNISVTPWCHLTPDLQVVTPFRDRVETSLVVGLRAKIDF